MKKLFLFLTVVICFYLKAEVYVIRNHHPGLIRTAVDAVTDVVTTVVGGTTTTVVNAPTVVPVSTVPVVTTPVYYNPTYIGNPYYYGYYGRISDPYYRWYPVYRDRPWYYGPRYHGRPHHGGHHHGGRHHR